MMINCDVVICQRLNPVRINVQLKYYSTDGSYSGPSAVKISDGGSDKAISSHNGFPQLATELNSTVDKSLKLENYDLCSACFRDMGNQTSIRESFGLLSIFLNSTVANFLQHLPPNIRWHLYQNLIVTSSEILLSGMGTVMSQCSPFTKIWKMRNNGTIFLPFGTQLVRVGDYLRPHDSAKLKILEIGFSVDEEYDITIQFFSPSVPGQYMSHWQMESPFGQKFGEVIWVIIQVDDHQSLYSAFLDLSLPPKSSQQNNKVIVDVDVEPLDSNNLSTEMLNPMAPDMLNSTWQDVTSVSESLPLVSYPVIDIPSSPNPPSDVLTEEDLVEQTLLRELDEMGFKQIDLNKEILRQNQYDLEHALEDLCGFFE